MSSNSQQLTSSKCQKRKANEAFVNMKYLQNDLIKHFTQINLDNVLCYANEVRKKQILISVLFLFHKEQFQMNSFESFSW